MKSVNQVTLLGNLTRDPELRYTPNGTPVCGFGLATNRSYKSGEEWKEVADFHNVVFWGKSAEIISQFTSKGKKLYVQGRLQTRDYTDRNGVKKYVTEIVGRDFILLTPKGEGAETVGEEKSQLEKDAEKTFGAKTEKAAEDEFAEILKEDEPKKEAEPKDEGDEIDLDKVDKDLEGGEKDEKEKDKKDEEGKGAKKETKKGK